jgi:hypothetical protein
MRHDSAAVRWKMGCHVAQDWEPPTKPGRFNQSFDILLNPQNFIKPTDGPGARSGKNLLLSVKDKT